MKKLFLNVFLACFVLVIIQACKDNDNVEPNTTITANDFTVSIAENPMIADVIGTVSASMSDGSTLTYTLSNENVMGALAIDANTGALTVADASAFDFETNPSITANYTASNGTEEATASITITLTDDESDNAFITTWETTTSNESITIPTNSSFTYNYTVDWGDGNTTTETGDATHTYTDAGTYQVSITGTFPAINFAGNLKIKSIDQWGEIEWETMRNAFFNCSNLTYNASDTPNLSGVTDLERMFAGTSAFNGDINSWDVSSITDMSFVFENATSFNQDLSNWDVSNVVSMWGMFDGATSFNQDLDTWDVSNVTDMTLMFEEANNFNGDISTWDVSSVTGMSAMFRNASTFNSNISNWNVSNVTNMQSMFARCFDFNQNLGAWNVSNVTNMQSMFFEASSFNQNISTWNVSSTTNMSRMFQSASAFNQNLSEWNTINVTSCSFFATGSPIEGTSNVPTAGSCF